MGRDVFSDHGLEGFEQQVCRSVFSTIPAQMLT
jgi:hypothetical protein